MVAKSKTTQGKEKYDTYGNEYEVYGEDKDVYDTYGYNGSGQAARHNVTRTEN